MALSYYFFNAQKDGDTYDRVYTASDITDYLDGIVGSGVFPTPSNSLQVYAGTGMQVIVRPGQGWIEGYKLINTADLALSIEAADVTLNRIDRVVFRVDKLNRLMQIAVKKGTNASSPTAPALTRDNDIIEYGLATVTVNRNTTAITESMIRDTRLDSSVCGVVQGLIQQVDTSTLFKQWNDAYDKQFEENQEAFDTWFDNVKSTLSNSAIFRRYTNSVKSTANTTTFTIGISQYVKELDILDVYVSGIRLNQSEYTINDAGTQVTLSEAVDKNTDIEFVVYKTVDSAGS